MDQNAFTAAIIISMVIEAVLDLLTKPLKQHWPDADFWWLVYPTFALGFLVGWVAEVNLLQAWVPNVIVARALSAACVAGGSQMIYMILKAIKDAAGAMQIRAGGGQ